MTKKQKQRFIKIFAIAGMLFMAISIVGSSVLYLF